MTVHNADIADTFNRLADLLEIEDANPFRVRAYRRAAMTVGDLPKSVAAMVAAGEDLTELPGVGEDLAEKIKEIAETGGLGALKEVEARTPSTLAALTAIPGLGPQAGPRPARAARGLHLRAARERLRRGTGPHPAPLQPRAGGEAAGGGAAADEGAAAVPAGDGRGPSQTAS